MMGWRWLCVLVVALFLAACASAPSADGGRGARPGYTDIGPEQLQAMLEQKDFVFVNTHIPYEGEIEPTDAFVPFDDIPAHMDQLPADKDAKIVLYCRSGRMSAIAAEELTQAGYTNVWNLEGGWIAWEQAGFPVVRR